MAYFLMFVACISQEHRERLSASQHERDGAQAALDATRQQLFATSNALEELRIEYEGLLSRHSALQGRMDQLVSLSASAATLSQSDL